VKNRFLHGSAFFALFGLLVALLAAPSTPLHAADHPRPARMAAPELAEFISHRSIGAATTQEFTTAEAAALTIRSYGLVEGSTLTGSVSEDSAPASIYDAINDGTLIKTIAVPAGTLRLVAETSDAEPTNIDLYIVYDADGSGTFESSEQVCSSKNLNNDQEYCDVIQPAAGAYAIIAHNQNDLNTTPDLVKLITAVVPEQNLGNFSVTGPISVAAEVPYSLELRWDLGDSAPGAHFYGGFDLGSGPQTPGDLGPFTSVNIVRSFDEIAKTVSNAQPRPGDYVTYTITVSNYNTLDTTYALTDSLPAGLTIDPASLTGGATYDAGSNSVRWSGVLGGATSSYTFTDSRSGGPSWPYFDVSSTTNALEICELVASFPDPDCDDAAANVPLGNNPLRFYGVNYSNVRIWSNGFLEIGDAPVDIQAEYYVAQSLPNQATPNNIFAGLWTDLNLDGSGPADAGGGKAYFNLLTGVNPGEPNTPYVAVQYKNAQQYNTPTSDLNFNLFARIDGVKSELCAVYGPTLTGNLETFSDGVTMGVENSTATQWKTYYHSADPATAAHMPAAGVTICAVEQAALPQSRTMTFRAQVSGSGPIINRVTATSSGDYGRASAQAALTINDRKQVYLPRISR
jgi:uncharacterized repeat protein (TIGR01451 family)